VAQSKHGQSILTTAAYKEFIGSLVDDGREILLGPTSPLFPAHVAYMYEHALTTTLLNYFGAIAIRKIKMMPRDEKTLPG
jgi:hypothetical protein